ncbi:MAG: FAD-dependent oxidoreductase [Actinomycetota bacterium]|nr:FAD-dependent oxidoreductase [Actinomycetota bacterium]
MDRIDVVVLGTGAAGLTAALAAHEGGARVAVFEKSDQIGGTSAWSGGHVWIPNNPHMAAVGASDSASQALTYIMSLSRGMIEQSLAEAYIDAGPEMVRFLDTQAGTEFYAVADFPDYHPEHPGGLPHGGRTLECPLFPFAELGAWAERVTSSPYFPTLHITMSETSLGKAVPETPSEAEFERRAVRDERGLGQSLVGRLLKACLDRGIEPQTTARARQLITAGGRVTGVLLDTPDGPLEIQAHQGVVLATGGFEWNEDYKRAFLRGPLTHPVSVPTNTGDGLYMAMKAGAMLGNMREAWWLPAGELPPGINAMNTFMLAGDRSRPRTIMVNGAARRFSNEAANYNAFGGAFHAEDVASFEYANLPCWMIFDHEYFRRYGTPGVPWVTGPDGAAPEWVTSAPTLRELAAQLGVPASGLETTVERWNKNVADGHDPDFHRGESAHDIWWGDPSYRGTVQATLGPLDEAPFYAVPVKSGALGTKGGPKVDGHAQVQDLDGLPIPGLYAAGNVMASPFGMTYGGAGGTLGPAMVFGYLAGCHAAASTPGD